MDCGDKTGALLVVWQEHWPLSHSVTLDVILIPVDIQTDLQMHPDSPKAQC